MLPILSQGTTKGLNLWLFTLIPALFPFLFFSSFLFQRQIPSRITRVLSGFFPKLSPGKMLLFSVILTGFLAGYPVGASLCASLYLDRQLDEKDALFLTAVTGNPSPGFIVTYVAGTSLHLPSLGVSFWLLLQGTSLLLCTVLRTLGFYGKGGKTGFSGFPSVPLPRSSVFSSLMTSLHSTFSTLLTIGGLVILFQIILSLLGSLFPPIFLVPLEVTSGIAILASSAFSLIQKTVLMGMLSSLGGLCTMAQIKEVFQQTGLSIRSYYLSRIFCSLFMGWILWFFWEFNRYVS